MCECVWSEKNRHQSGGSGDRERKMREDGRGRQGTREIEREKEEEAKYYKKIFLGYFIINFGKRKWGSENRNIIMGIIWNGWKEL